MEKQIYNLELLRFKRELIKEFISDINSTLLLKMRSNSKAQTELRFFIKSLDLKLQNLDNSIKVFLETNKEEFSNFKIKTGLLSNLIELKHELEVGSISELLELFVINYGELILSDDLIEIENIELNKILKRLLNKTHLFISQSKESKEKILYKIDDLIIKNDTEYLNIKKYKKYKIRNDYFLISLRCSLQDIDELESLWK